ncbi:MAG: hypothetical protein ACI9AT_000248 [Ulvibacter sp.]|jgi:hypothetical protein
MYYTFHIDDSGAIEDIDERMVNGKDIPICKMYDDPEFNKLNDILHSMNDYILNRRALDIIAKSNTIEHVLRNAKVLRKEKVLGFFSKWNSYEYFELSFPDISAAKCYDWIDFGKSDIVAFDESGQTQKIKSHQHNMELIEENKSDSNSSYSFESKKIVFGRNFDSTIDLFRIPHYSWGAYISERLKVKLEEAKICDVGFAETKEELGKVWKPYFPIIEFME